ncbi:hypothetical protein [Actinoplanes sp. NPDC049316]|uniref:hypothetical protein n=1 Tax=Actinoplanes sp. NPDC049316 TaxID=3154727 RepID=UPI0034454D54
MVLWIEMAIVLLAVARLTRLICADKITDPFRTAAAQRLKPGSMWTYLLYCRWCVSVWIAVPAAAIWWAASPASRWSGHWWLDIPTTALALSYATGLLVRAEPEA